MQFRQPNFCGQNPKYKYISLGEKQCVTAIGKLKLKHVQASGLFTKSKFYAVFTA